MNDNSPHKLVQKLGNDFSGTFEVVFTDGDVLLLKNMRPIDPTIYQKNGLWSAECVGIIQMSGNEKGLIHVGSGVDFDELEVLRITRRD